MSRRYVPLVLFALVAAPAIPGCVHASAKTVADTPPLEMPAPPPRVIETVDVTPPAPAPLVEEPPRQLIRPAPRPVPRPPATTADASRPEPPKAENAPGEPPARAAEDAAKPPTTLQTTPAGTEAEVERAIRIVIARANVDLRRVDYRALNTDARAQYNSAKRFIQQAEDALRPPRNLVFARSLADKALALAAQLAGR